MSKKAMVIIAVVLCLFCMQSVFAGKEYPQEYRVLEVKGEEEGFYTLAEAYWYSPTIYSVEVLEFLQAYMMPEDPVAFYLQAAQMTDEEIEECGVIFMSFVEPEYAGNIRYEYRCDLEAIVDLLGYEYNDPAQPYELSYFFETPEFFNELFPMGIGRANAYDSFRRCAIHLAFYAAKHGSTPGFQVCYDYIQDALDYYESQFDSAMEAEAIYEAELEAAQLEIETEETVNN